MATKKDITRDALIAERAKIVFNAIVENDGDVFAIHNGDEVQLKTVAVADGKLVGIVTPTDLLKIISGMKTTLTAEDAINTTCVTAYQDEPLTYTIPAMRISDVTALPVLDDHGDLVGIITDRDLFDDQVKDADAMKLLGITDDSDLAGYRNVLPLFYAATDRYLQDDRKVKDFMVTDPLTIFKKTLLSDVAKLMLNHDFGQLPVHGTKDELIGMIYDVDVLKALLK